MNRRALAHQIPRLPPSMPQSGVFPAPARETRSGPDAGRMESAAASLRPATTGPSSRIVPPAPLVATHASRSRRVGRRVAGARITNHRLAGLAALGSVQVDTSSPSAIDEPELAVMQMHGARAARCASGPGAVYATCRACRLYGDEIF